MGSTNPQKIDESSVAVATSYGASVSSAFQVGVNDYTTLIFKINAEASTTGVTIKPQVQASDDEWVDLYRAGESAFVADEILIPVESSTDDQYRAIRLDTKGISDMRLAFKSVGGTASIELIEAVRDGTSTNTPRS